MNVALWVAQIVLALAFLAAGLMKVSQPKDKLQASLPWTSDFSQGTVRLIGTAEVLGALGLILPAVTGIAPILTPVAATALAVVMVLAAIVHARRKEPQAIGANVVLLLIALFIAWGRFGAYAF